MQGSDVFRLVVRRGPQPNQVYELNKDVITVGRDITNDIVINDPEVSRHHMRFTRGAGGYTLEDLGSTNGTFIGGQRLTGAKPLSSGELIGLGETVTLVYESAASAPGRSPAELAGQMPPAASSPYAPGAAAAPRQQQPAPPPYSYSQPTAAEYEQPQAPTGYGEYDPYAAREFEQRNTMRWVLIGCVALLLFCCCATTVGLVIVDQACLWDDIPILSNILNSLGFFSAC